MRATDSSALPWTAGGNGSPLRGADGLSVLHEIEAINGSIQPDNHDPSLSTPNHHPPIIPK
jgi:hypothetical protein